MAEKKSFRKSFRRAQLKITGVNNYFLDRVASYPTARHTQRPRRLPKLTDAYENQFVTILQ